MFNNRIVKLNTCPSCGKESSKTSSTALTNEYYISKGATLLDEKRNIYAVQRNVKCVGC